MKTINSKEAVAIGILGIIAVLSILAPILAPYDPNKLDMSAALMTPCSEHWLGTDAVGRDLLSRTLYGGRASVLLALAVTMAALLAGMLVGLLAGYYGRWLDWVLTGISGIFEGIPGTTIVIAIVGILGPGIPHMVLALMLTSWVGFSRITRGETMRMKEEGYVISIRGLGAGDGRILFRTLLKNMMPNLLVVYTTRVGSTVLSVASLSFLGLGVMPPIPDWGVMISDSVRYFRSYPHLLWPPGLCLIFLVLGINLLGDALRDRLDVKNDAYKEY